jgi:prephenate dehydrogenase
MVPSAPVAILGPGLIGGSLGLALQHRHPGVEIRAWARRDEALEGVRRLGFAALASTDLAAVVRGAKIVVLCTPVETMPDLCTAMRDALAPGAIVTDAGSVKAGVVAACEAVLGGRFVGAHPIAGSDRTGIDAAQADLYDGATCVLTPTPRTSTDALTATRALWESVGCTIVELSPDAHDAALARTSHLPHAAASALAILVAREVQGWQKLVGGGYRDTTRIAGGNPDLWTGILLANRTGISTSIAEFVEILQNIRSALDAGDEKAVRALLAEGRDARHQLDVF